MRHDLTGYWPGYCCSCPTQVHWFIVQPLLLQVRTHRWELFCYCYYGRGERIVCALHRMIDGLFIMVVHIRVHWTCSIITKYTKRFCSCLYFEHSTKWTHQFLEMKILYVLGFPPIIKENRTREAIFTYYKTHVTFILNVMYHTTTFQGDINYYL